MKRIVRITAVTLSLTLLALASGHQIRGPARAQDSSATPQSSSPEGAFATTVAYVVTFYPLWFTFNQSRFGTPNRLVGPDRISPLYHSVVAVNDDTLYASSFIDLTAQPVIVTAPGTTLIYSVLTL